MLANLDLLLRKMLPIFFGSMRDGRTCALLFQTDDDFSGQHHLVLLDMFASELSRDGKMTSRGTLSTEPSSCVYSTT